MIEDILGTIGFREEETKVYISLLEGGSTSAGALAKKMRLPRPTLYGYLEKLGNAGLVAQSVSSGIKQFQAEPPSRIKQLYQRKIEALQQNNRSLDDLIPQLETMVAKSSSKPRMHFYEGREGAESIWEDVLFYPDTHTRIFWPTTTMTDLVGEDFVRYHNKERIKKNISIQALWLKKDIPTLKRNPYLGSSKKLLRETRLTPEHADSQMGYWIYGPNKVLMLSSARESFGMIIESAEFAQMMKAQHQMIWQISEPLPPSEFNDRMIDDFMNEMDADE